MKYIAIMYSKEKSYTSYEWMSVSSSEASAKQAVFDGFNTYLMKRFELEDKLPETTIEHLRKRLQYYYWKTLGGELSLDTLEKHFPIHILDVIEDECYRDGHKVPKKPQDY